MHSTKLILSASLFLSLPACADLDSAAIDDDADDVDVAYSDDTPETKYLPRPEGSGETTRPTSTGVGPNTIKDVNLKVDGPYPGNYVKFDIDGYSYPANPKCLVSVGFEREPNQLHPYGDSFSKQYYLEAIPTQLETVSLMESGAWTVTFKPVQDCEGDAYQFSLDVLPSLQELEPIIYGLQVPGAQQYLQNGQAGQITIEGKGDLSTCQLELSLTGPVAEAGTYLVDMKGDLTYAFGVTVSFPPGYPSGSYAWVDVELTPVDGCKLVNGNSVLDQSFTVWSSL